MNLKPLKSFGFKSRFTFPESGRDGTILDKANQFTPLILMLLLVCDFAFSFLQYYNLPLSGDIDGGVLQNHVTQQIFEDPFGFNAVITGEKHINPNRFFSHYFISVYFQKIPVWLQNFTDPISSVYLSSALIKITIQVLFVYFLASFISKSNNPGNKIFLTCAIIISPLFQVDGYWSRMGINDKAVAYVFFYAFPLVLLIIFFLPVFNRIVYDKKIRTIHYVLLFPLILVLPFSGPLVPPVAILVTFLIILKYLIQCKGKKLGEILKSIPSDVYILLIPFSLWSFYSIFLGYYYDSNYQSETITLAERYYRLPAGLLSQTFHSLGFPLLLFFIGMNIFLIKKNEFPEGEKIARILMWIGMFAFLYILFLPFGGYRPYRPRIIRYDTFMPVTIALIYYFAASTYFLLQHFKGNKKKRYLAGLIVVLLIYTLSDTGGFGENNYERMAFEKMEASDDTVVAILKDCFIMSWENTTDYKQSESRARLIHYWRITSDIKLFYNEQTDIGICSQASE